MNPLSDPNRPALLHPRAWPRHSYEEFWADVLNASVWVATEGKCPECGSTDEVVSLVWRGSAEGMACGMCGFSFDTEMEIPNPFLEVTA